MYYILWNKKYDFFDMQKDEAMPFIFSTPGSCRAVPPYCELKEINIEREALYAFLFNSGFNAGYLDMQKFLINKLSVSSYMRNANSLNFVQYLLTEDDSYKSRIRPYKLYTYARVEDDDLYLASAVDENSGKRYFLTFTDKYFIPKELQLQYKDYRLIRFPLEHEYVVNLELMVN